MNDEKLLKKIKKAIDDAPIDILETIKKAPRTKMRKHDGITRQFDRKEKITKVMPYSVVAAVFLVILISWQFQMSVPAGEVYLDVNPSIHFTFNQKKEVIKLEADNLKAKEMIKGLEFKGKPIDTVIEKILDKMVEKNYLSPGKNYLLLSVATKDEQLNETQRNNLERIIRDHLKEKDMQLIVLKQVLDQSGEIEKLAQEYNISINKMTLIRNIMGLNEELNEADLVKLSLAELVELMQENNLNAVQ